MQVKDKTISRAFKEVPREEFLPEYNKHMSKEDRPLPIGYAQTCSQPSLLLYIMEHLELNEKSRVLEIGCGCGYQAALIAAIAKQVYAIEIIPELAIMAASNLKRLNYTNASIRCIDGYGGWPEEAPFDAIIISAAAAQLPIPLTEQIKEGGHVIMPLGNHFSAQHLYLFTKVNGVMQRQMLIPVVFVPCTGKCA